MRALYFRELSSFLSSTIGYVFVLIYLIASGLFHWILAYNTNLLEGSEADLIPFFNLSPVVFLVLCEKNMLTGLRAIKPLCRGEIYLELNGV